MIKQLHIYIIAFICILVTGCTLPSPELKTAEQLIETKPDSALHILRNLSPDTYKSGANRALYGLLLIRSLDKKHLPLKPDSLLDYSISYYEKHPEGNHLAYAFLLEGRKFYYESKYEKAVTSFLKSRDEVKDTTDYLLMGRISDDIGRISYIQSDYNYSRYKYQQAARYYLKGNHKLQYFYAMLEIGKIYIVAKDYSSAILHFKKMQILTTDSIKKGDIISQIGFVYYKKNNSDSALYYFRKSI
jgi:tetratricopeptide (TPR) repeat protein